MGGAVFANGHMVGTLTGAQTQMLRMLTGDFTALEYSVDGTIYQLRRLWPTRRSMNGNTLDAHLFLLAHALDGMPIEDPQALADALAQDARALMETLLSLGSDAVGFGRTQLMRHLTQESWDSARFIPSGSSYNVNVRVSLFAL
jgi:hypothetical protein